MPYASDHFSLYLVDDVSVIESTETANAGPDVVVAHGDSVHIGSYDEGMPCNWYRLGSSTVLTHNGGLWVKPDSSTSYVVELDLCGVVTRDTVRVMVDRTNVNVQMRKYANVQMWPNPSNGEVTIEHAAGAVVVMSDMTGREMKRVSVVGDKEVIDISSLPKGVYVVCVVDGESGYRIARKIVKE